MKLFGSTFDKLENFRYQLKQGAPDSIFAFFGFIIISLISVIVIVIISASLIDDHNTVKNIGAGALYTACFTLVYNIVKAAFECFLAERERIFNKLRDE
jgi:hypothetical protein